MLRARYSCQLLTKIEFLDRYANIKIDENSSSGSRVVPCGRTDGKTDTKKLTVAIRKFAKASKQYCPRKHILTMLLIETSVLYNFATYSDKIRHTKMDSVGSDVLFISLPDKHVTVFTIACLYSLGNR